MKDAMTDHKAEWVLVPRVATEAMEAAGQRAACREDLRWNDLNADEVWDAMIAAAPAASEGEDGAVLWISPEDFRNPHFVGINAVRAGHEQHGKHYTMPLYLRPAAQVADTPKHDEGQEAWTCECGQRNTSWATECGRCERLPPGDALAPQPAAVTDECGRPMTYWGGKSATQPAARRVTDDPRVAELIAATTEFMRDDAVESVAEVCDQLDRIRAALESFAQPAEGVSGE